MELRMQDYQQSPEWVTVTHNQSNTNKRSLKIRVRAYARTLIFKYLFNFCEAPIIWF
jgi:hypothetical protein